MRRDWNPALGSLPKSISDMISGDSLLTDTQPAHDLIEPKPISPWHIGEHCGVKYDPSCSSSRDPLLLTVKALPEVLPPLRGATDEPHRREQEFRLLFGCRQARQNSSEEYPSLADDQRLDRHVRRRSGQ
jgi:hypothetical protein